MHQDLTREQIEQTVIRLAAEQVSVAASGVFLETNLFADLNFDSLDVVDFVMHLEEAFEIVIPDGKAESVRLVGDAVELLAADLAGASR